jgi:hypothetical protein
MKFNIQTNSFKQGTFFPFLTDKRQPNASPDALPAMRRTPQVGESNSQYRVLNKRVSSKLLRRSFLALKGKGLRDIF